jgi:Tat protein translocase TatB subunit
MGTPPTIEIASFGFENSLVLMVLALVVFGPRRLPQIGRQIGKLMYEFRKASNDFKFQMEEELRNAEDQSARGHDHCAKAVSNRGNGSSGAADGTGRNRAAGHSRKPVPG